MIPSRTADEIYEHARYLVEEIGPRGSTTRQEQQAGEYFASQVKEVGLEAQGEAFSSPKSAWQPVGTCVALSLGSLLLSWAGGLWVYASLLLALAAVYWALREVNLDDTPVNRALSWGKSENRWAVIAPREEKKARAVLVAHLDSHRTPLMMQSEVFASIFTVVNLVGYPSLAAVPIYLGGRALGWWGNNLAATLVLGTLLAILDGLIFQADFTKYSPGANDNAAAVGMALACARHFKEQPLRNTEVLVLASGCEEVACYGMRRFLDRHGAEAKEAKFIDLEMIGRGKPSVTVREGLLFKQRCDIELEEICERACQRLGLKLDRNESQVYGEGYVINKLGYAGITINAIPEGKPDVYWHTPRDTLDKLDKDALELVFNWTVNILEEIDQKAG